jgi:hypothetical protein
VNPIAYVFPIDVKAGFFGILRYRPETTVEVIQTEVRSALSLCLEMQRTQGSTFEVADRDQMAWGKTLLRMTAQKVGK